MTLPHERFRAVTEVERFLMALVDPSVTPRVPSVVRRRAGLLLRHYPTLFDIERTADVAPDIFSKEW
jgi:hypothetical protein